MATFKENFGKIWKARRTKVWMIVSAVLLVLILAIGIVATQIGLIFGTINLVFGGYRYKQVQDSPKYFTSEFESKEASSEYVKGISEKIVEEGIVLLKNEGNVLPVKTPVSDTSITVKPKISVFGKHSVNMVYGGSGSGGRSADKVVKLYDALEAEGFDYNPTLKSFYDGSQSGTGRPGKSPNMGDILAGLPIYETEVSKYNDTVKNSYSTYKDAAIVVLSRTGGEGFDLPRTMRKAQNVNGEYEPYKDARAWGNSAVKADGARDIDDHYLQLDTNETDLLAHVCENFDNVIVLLNSGTAMELGFLDDPGHYAYSDKIKAALWIGNPGGQGNTAVAKILSGSANPSGRLTDTYSRDFKKDPSWANFGNNLVEFGDRYFVGSWGSPAVGDDAYFVRYEEGIYVGYRYYETRGFTEGGDALSDYTVRDTTTAAWNNWYGANIVYPFGHGLSYTTFAWEIDDVSLSDGSGLDADDTVTIDVKVTNTGTAAGKDVVQLYFTAEYYDGSVEKSHVVLGDFAKTALIAPGGNDTVRLEINARDMASYVYDRNLENSDGHIGYKLEAGAYTLRVARNAHQSWVGIADELTLDYVVSDDINFTKNELGAEVTNRFDDVSSHITRTAEDLDIFKHKEGKAYLTRSDWEGSWPTPPVERGDEDSSYNILTGGNIGLIQAPLSSHTVTKRYDVNKPWTVADEDMPTYGKNGSLKLTDLIGKDYDDPLWDDLLDQLTISDMEELIGVGAFATSAIGTIGKPPTLEWDGPGGFVVGSFMSASENPTDVCFFPCESLIGATWSKDLTYEMGRCIGEEGIWGGRVNGVDYTFGGWYAPAVNIHRSQFGGRNFEYYSEDGFLSGKLAANVVAGAKTKGVYAFVKHFAVNDMETNRSDNGIVTWLNEQALREIYLKAFELTVKENKRETKNLRTGETIVVTEGGTTAMMSSFNRLGTTWAGGSYALLTEVLRNEWGFKGMVITDFNNGAGTYMDLDRMIRAGGDLNLFQTSWLSTSKDKLTATHVTAMRKASHNILYTVANSNAMNVAVGGRMMPMWVVVMILIFVAIILGLAVWGFFVICSVLKVLMYKDKSGSGA